MGMKTYYEDLTPEQRARKIGKVYHENPGTGGTIVHDVNEDCAICEDTCEGESE